MNHLNDPDFNFEPPANADKEVLREYGRTLAMHGILKSSFEPGNVAKVQSLSEARRRAKSKRNRKFYLFGAASIAALFILFIGVGYIEYIDRGSRVLQVEELTGKVNLIEEGKEPRLLGRDDLLFPGAVVSTDKNSTLKLINKDGSVISVAPRTVFENESNRLLRWGKRLLVKEGKIELNVAKQPKGRPCLVTTPFSQAKVLGTQFSISVKDDHAKLLVIEGRVAYGKVGEEISFVVNEGQVSLIGEDIETVEEFDPSEPRVQSFSLVNVKNQEVMPRYDPLSNGDVIRLSEIPGREINIVANTTGSVSYVAIKRSDETKQFLEKYPPFTVGLDSLHKGGKYLGMKVNPGILEIESTPFDRDGNPGKTKAITIVIEK